MGEASRLATAPTLADEAAHCAHLSLTGWKGYVGDALKKFVFESGPISRQRWLHKERRYRNSADPTEVVAKSLRGLPAGGGELERALRRRQGELDEVDPLLRQKEEGCLGAR